MVYNIKDNAFHIKVTPKDNAYDIMGGVPKVYSQPTIHFYFHKEGLPKVQYSLMDYSTSQYEKNSPITFHAFTFDQLKKNNADTIVSMIGGNNLHASVDIKNYFPAAELIESLVRTHKNNEKYAPKKLEDIENEKVKTVDPIIRLYITSNDSLTFNIPEYRASVISGDHLVGGFYNDSNKNIYTQSIEHHRTIFHEAGHSLHFKYPEIIDQKFGDLVMQEIKEHPEAKSSKYLSSPDAKILYETDQKKINEIFVEIFAEYSELSCNKSLSLADIGSKICESYPLTGKHFMDKLLPIVHANILSDYSERALKVFDFEVLKSSTDIKVLLDSDYNIDFKDNNFSLAHATKPIFRLLKAIDEKASLAANESFVSNINNKEFLLHSLGQIDMDRLKQFTQMLINSNDFNKSDIGIFSASKVEAAEFPNPISIKINTSSLSRENSEGLIFSLTANNMSFTYDIENKTIKIDDAAAFIKLTNYNILESKQYQILDKVMPGKDTRDGMSRLQYVFEGELRDHSKLLMRTIKELTDTFSEMKIDYVINSASNDRSAWIDSKQLDKMLNNIEVLSNNKDITNPTPLVSPASGPSTVYSDKGKGF